jgi:hypothetical protein
LDVALGKGLFPRLKVGLGAQENALLGAGFPTFRFIGIGIGKGRGGGQKARQKPQGEKGLEQGRGRMGFSSPPGNEHKGEKQKDHHHQGPGESLGVKGANPSLEIPFFQGGNSVNDLGHAQIGMLGAVDEAALGFLGQGHQGLGIHAGHHGLTFLVFEIAADLALIIHHRNGFAQG